MNNIESKVKEIIQMTLCCELEELNLDTNLREDAGADSLDAVEILMNIEKEYNISIPDQEAEGMDTVGKIVKYLESKNVASI